MATTIGGKMLLNLKKLNSINKLSIITSTFRLFMSFIAFEMVKP